MRILDSIKDTFLFSYQMMKLFIMINPWIMIPLTIYIIVEMLLYLSMERMIFMRLFYKLFANEVLNNES